MLSRVANLGIDLGLEPGVIETAIGGIQSSPADPGALASVAELRARLALKAGQQEAARAFIEDAVFEESRRPLPYRLPSLYVLLATADPERRAQHVGAAYAALQNLRPRIPQFDPLTDESMFSMHMRKVFEAAASAQLEVANDDAGLHAAQRIVEDFREAELQSALGSECLPQRSPLQPGDLAEGEALLYPLVFEDRLELIFVSGRGDDTRFVRLPPNRNVGGQHVAALAERLAVALNSGSDGDWRVPARELYDLLIKPIEHHLDRNSSLAIIPDRAMRGVPFAMLMAGDGRYLVERTALSVAPALAYSQPGSQAAGEQASIVAASLEREVTLAGTSFPALAGTGTEARNAAEHGRPGRWLADFTREELAAALSAGSADVLHLATHASFNGRSDKAFIVARDGLIPIAELRDMISKNSVRDGLLDLLVLSACETAVGDDEIEHGLGRRRDRRRGGQRYRLPLAGRRCRRNGAHAAVLRQLPRRHVARTGAAHGAGFIAQERRRQCRSLRLGGIHSRGGVAINRRVFVSIIALASADAGWAQLSATPPAATVITPDTLAGRSLGTTTSTLGPVTTIDGGTVSGTNLFHSFSVFDLAAGDTAAWVHSAGDPASIGNVINRVTGGTASQIFGTINSTALPNADFFFINPAGIVFGQGAQVNVPAAAHFSTASNLHFANGDTLAIAAPDGSTLSVASPTAFGFLGNEGDILMSGAGRTKYGAEPEFSPGAQSLHLSGHNVSLIGSGIRATGISLAAVGAVNTLIPLDGQVEGLQGSLILSEYTHLNSAEPGSGGYQSFLGSGDITIRAGSLTSNLAFFDTQGYDGEHSGSVDIGVTGHADMSFTEIYATGAYGSDGGDISFHAGSADMNRVTFASGTYWGEADNRGGDINVVAEGALTMSASGFSSENWSPGRGGDISVTAGSLVMDGSGISTTSPYGGDGGDITVDAGDILVMKNFSNITAGSGDGVYGFPSGTGGDVTIGAVELAMFSDPSEDYPPFTGGGFIGSVASGASNGGDVNLYIAGAISMDNGATISASGAGGLSGDISLFADSASLSQRSSISSDTGNGEGGQIGVSVGSNLQMSGSEITSKSSGNGSGGLIGAFVGGELALTNGSSIVANASGDGRTGSIQIGAATMTLVDGSSVATNARGKGDGGSITVAVGDLSLTDSKVTSTSGVQDSPAGTTGPAGDIQVFAETLALTGSLIQVDAFDDGDGGIVDVQVSGDMLMTSSPAAISEISSNAWRNGDGGDVTITSGGHITMFQSAISSRAGISLGLARGPGQGGNVSLNAAGLQMTDAVIQSNARGQADGGTVNIALTDTLTMDLARISTFSLGSGMAGQIDISTGSAWLSASTISSEALETGSGGAVQLSALDLLQMDSTKISSDALSTTGTGDAGNVAVSAGYLSMVNGAEIASSAKGDGQGGLVFVSSGSAYLSNALIQSNAHGVGDAGGITIFSESLELFDNSIVQSTSYGEGHGGAVDITAGILTATAGSLIAADSVGSGNAGGVFINAGLLSLSDGAILASRSAGSGNGGLIWVDTDYLDMTGASWIQTDSFGSGNAGNIFIDAHNVIVEGSSIRIDRLRRWQCGRRRGSSSRTVVDH